METSAAHAEFTKIRRQWDERSRKLGERYVGHVGEDPAAQQLRIEALLRQRLDANTYYEHVLDLGCGWGRFLSFIGGYAGHIWAVDLLPERLEQARCQIPHVTVLKADWPYRLALPDKSVNLLWCCFALQNVQQEELYQLVLQETRRVMTPLSRVLILDNGKLRKPEALATALGLRRGWQAVQVTINNKPRDTWLIDGIVA